MARIASVDLPVAKRIDVALTYIFGLGPWSARSILQKTGIDGARRVKDLKEEDIVKLRETIERGFKVEGDLRKDITMSIKRLVDTGSYRGVRHRRALPVRGQRSKTNARTRKGKRSSIGRAKKITRIFSKRG